MWTSKPSERRLRDKEILPKKEGEEIFPEVIPIEIAAADLPDYWRRAAGGAHRLETRIMKSCEAKAEWLRAEWPRPSEWSRPAIRLRAFG